MSSGDGTILEAAFIDPSYSYPPAEGQGRHAIELQATPHLLQKVEPDNEETKSLATQSSSVASINSGDMSVTRAPIRAEEKLRKHKLKISKTQQSEVVTYRGCLFFKCCKTVETGDEILEYATEEPDDIDIEEAREKAV